MQYWGQPVSNTSQILYIYPFGEWGGGLGVGSLRLLTGDQLPTRHFKVHLPKPEHLLGQWNPFCQR